MRLSQGVWLSNYNAYHGPDISIDDGVIIDMSSQQQPRTILITGATGGMGRACAQLAATRGYNLVLSDLNDDKLKDLAEECTQTGVVTDYHVLDISDSAAIDRFTTELERGIGLDAVIHTVGLSPQMAAWDKIIEVDLIGAVGLLEALKPAIHTGGCAVCISSMSAHMIPPNPEVEAILSTPLAAGLVERLEALADKPLADSGLAYAYAKKALLAYVTNEAMAWGKEGKRLVSISPGLIDTDMGRLEADAQKETFAAMRNLVALQRDGNPEEIASAALFLASDEASYITGCDLLVDGGFVASILRQQRQGQL